MKSLPPKTAAKIRTFWWRCLAVLLIGLALLGGLVWEKFFHQYPQTLPINDELAEFKYGSIGTEEAGGIPYWIWQVLPQVFPEHLPGPGGYASLGMVWEAGSEMPVGFTKRHIGYERVGINCAACHTGSYRLAMPGGGSTVTTVVPGAPAVRLDVQGYLQFLSACAQDPRFNADNILSAIAYNHKMSALDKVIYRYALIPGTKKALQQQATEAKWQQTRPPWGAGRIDPFNPVKFGMLKMDPAADPTVGNSDMMPFWQMQARQTSNGYHLHWDGLSTNLMDCSLAGALGDGATTKSLPIESITRMVDVARTLPPPIWPGKVDHAKAEQGKALYLKHCARCHAPGGGVVNEPIDWRDDESGLHITDHNRLAMWNTADRSGEFPYEIYNRFADGYYWDLNSFVPTSAYISVPLNGLWLRGPYLHNGSVPSVLDLLHPPASNEQARQWIDQAQPGLYQWLGDTYSSYENFAGRVSAADQQRLRAAVPKVVAMARAAGKRPPLFFRGNDLIDEEALGFNCVTYERTDHGFPFVVATFIQGNSNAGHLYGIHLSDEEKLALVEYLKTESVQGEPK